MGTLYTYPTGLIYGIVYLLGASMSMQLRWWVLIRNAFILPVCITHVSGKTYTSRPVLSHLQQISYPFMEVGILIGTSSVLYQLFQWCNGWQSEKSHKRTNDKNGFIYIIQWVHSYLSLVENNMLLSMEPNPQSRLFSLAFHKVRYLALCCF